MSDIIHYTKPGSVPKNYVYNGEDDPEPTQADYDEVRSILRDFKGDKVTNKNAKKFMSKITIPKFKKMSELNRWKMNKIKELLDD